MKAIAETTKMLDLATFLGIVLGIGGLVVGYFSEDLRFLAWPALAVLLPSLIWGMR